MPFLGHVNIRRIILIAVCILSVAVAAATFYLWRKENARVQVTVPDAISKQLLFQPHLPQHLPADYRIQRNSFQINDGVLVFTAFDSKARTITFSEQTTPKGFDYAKFYQEKMIKPTQLSTRPYTSIFGQLKDRDSAMLGVITDRDTWVLVVLPTHTNTNEAAAISQGLQLQ